MLIQKIILHNIRSYVDAEISLNEGRTLIAGDIGSGKSTILLATEFALFGLLKGEISGSTLLRHGENSGFAELHFEIAGKEIIIRRALKRSAKGIDQDAGFIVQNGRKQDLMPTELKAIILGILGYPAELVAKSKSLLFRYTVYAPQEEMKKILFSDNDERLNIIRRIFGIDKYKRVRENADIYSLHLRERCKELNGRLIDLPEKKLRLQNLEAEFSSAKSALEASTPVLNLAKISAEKAKMRVAELEQRKKQHNELKRTLDICAISLKHLEDEKSRTNAESLQLNARISAIKSELENTTLIDSLALKQEILQKNSELNSIEKEKIALVSENAGSNALQKSSFDTIKKMQSLDVCPLCLQKVDEAHKASIIYAENSKIKSTEEKCAHILAAQKDLDSKILAKKNEVETLKVKEKSAELTRFKQQDLSERWKQLEALAQRLAKTEAEVVQVLGKNKCVEQEIQQYSTIEEESASAKRELDCALTTEKNAEIQYNLLREKAANIEKNKGTLEIEVVEKEKLSAQLERLKKLGQWVTGLFCPLVESIEKQVLARIYTEFNELFKQWFGLLVEDEMFSARLDDSFAPILQQNGFDTLPENLSGGEKTACALAYRLALNKVVNDVMTLIQTRDLLILDEPTDGFSDAQLDKVRDVIDSLGLKQIIIVSHEKKVEGFVDSVVRISKSSHSSTPSC